MVDFSDVLVLIPTINETTLDDVVSGVLAQTNNAEIWILGFGKAEIVAREHNVKFLDLEKKTPKSIALNIAINRSMRRWIIVLDADAIPMPNWASSMLQAFLSGFQLFTGSININEGNFWMRVYNLSMFHEFLVNRPSSFRKHIPAINLGFTRDAYKIIGPFREDLKRCQDYEWSLRAYSKGIIPVFFPSPEIIHIPVEKQNFNSLWRYWKNQGFDNVRIRLQYKDILNTPSIFNYPLLVIIFSPFLALWPTLRILFTSPQEFFNNLRLIPFIYLTKIAWCLGIVDGKKNILLRLNNKQ